MRKPSAIVIAVVSVGAAVGAVAVALAVALSAGDGGRAAESGGPAAPTSGCTEVTTQELYVQHAFTCPDSTRVLTFATTQSRDDYLRVAEGFGTVTVDKGATWARTRS